MFDVNFNLDKKFFNIGFFQKIFVSETSTGYADYNFFVNFVSGGVVNDSISGEELAVNGLAAGRVSYLDGPYGINEPAIDENGLFGSPAFEQLIPYSDDIREADSVSGTVLSADSWQADSTAQRCRFSVYTQDSVLYTFSCKIKSIGRTSSIYLEHYSSESGNYYDIKNLSDQYQEYATTVLGKLGGGIVSFGVRDLGSAPFPVIFIKEMQVTATQYKMPFVFNDTGSALAIPENFSDADQGYKFPIDEMPELRDALDGVADGVDVFDNIGAEGANISVVGNTATVNTTGTGNDNRFFITRSLINAEIAVTFSLNQECTIKVYDYGIPAFITQQLSAGTHSIRVLASGSGSVNMTAVDAGTVVTINSLEHVSPAQGKITVKWRPMFSSGDLTGTINILTANDEASSFLLFDADNDLLKLTDGTNTSQVACSPVADTEYEITAQYDETNGMVISLSESAGTTVDFAGRFPIADDLSYFWEAEAPQYVKITHIEKESGL